MFQDERIRRIILSSLPLRRALPDKHPTNTQSGCILAHGGKRILLTAAHGPKPGQHWGIELSTDFQKGRTQLYAPPGGLHFLEQAGIGGNEGVKVDLAYAEVPIELVSWHQEWTPFGGLTRDDARLDVTLGPNVMSKRPLYGFHGYPADGFVGNMLTQNQRIESDLKYVSQEAHIRTFLLNHDHPGHDYYKGCSGSAIIDKDGRLSGIVVSGNVEERHIYAVAPSLFIDAILAALGANNG